MNKKPIGFIDSGFGGLTVVREALKQLPHETIYFLGDSKRCPYGSRTTEEIKQFTWEMVDFLMKKDIKMLVIACNTATAAALNEIKQKLPIPVIGVIEPGSRAAIKASKNNRIGIIGTQSTITSGVYENTLIDKKETLQVFNLACPKFVPLVESNQMNTTQAYEIVRETLTYFKDTDIDTLVLGCTHYPHLKDSIQCEVGKDVLLIDSGVETIADVSSLLDYLNIANDTTDLSTHRFFTTGDAKQFEQIAKQWIDLPKLRVESVDIEKENQDMLEKTLVIATKNKGKAKEFEAIFGEKGYVVKTLLDYPEIEDVEETGTTFEENARLKAETISKLLGTMVISDDSGLMVEALDNQPGVYSARYAGEPKSDARNNAKLLAELSALGSDVSRKAKFHCTLVLARPDHDSIVVSGELVGEIATVPQGENGFGYDPLFYVSELGKTTAQLEPSEKNAISHRKRAIQALLVKAEELGLL